MKTSALRSRLARTSLSACCLMAAVSIAQSGEPRPALSESGPTELAAVYQISLNGFDIGSFRYTSETRGQSFKLTSDVELSLLLGAIHWKGLSLTQGTTSGTMLKPSSFAFDYTSTLKNGAVRMGFAKGVVDSVALNPIPAPQPDMVPVRPEHLTGVLDPLSAVMALTQATGGQPCDRKLAIFDGRQRFDLQLSYRRQEITDNGGAALTVCRVKYVPISGYRPTEETANLARSTGIEISFRSMPGAKLNVPHKITLPTLAGTAEITVQHVDVRTPGMGQVALIDE